LLDLKKSAGKEGEMEIYSIRSSFVRTTAHRPKCVGRSRLLRVSGIAAFLILASIAAVLAAVQSGKAQTINAGAKSSVSSSGNPQNGKLVFMSRSCSRCHGSQGEAFSAPGQKGGVPRIAPTTLTLADFIQRVRKPKGQMPPFASHQVSDLELADVYAFLQSSTPPGEQKVSSEIHTDPKNGQQLFREYGCYECHLSHGQGSRVAGARVGPPQIPLSAFISYVRAPSGEMPPYTQRTVSDQELSDMFAFLKSVPQPAPWKSIPLLNQ
jgi:mono/diheme cytochrome c family protein